MEIIKNYLENMFANLPNTSEVLRAKKELGQMMEDKYNELIQDGVSENEAVGTVISEFGNLDELAEELGLTKEVEEERIEHLENPRHQIGLDEARDYLRDQAKRALGVGLGVALCIMSVGWPVLTGATELLPDMLGVMLMMVMIAAGVILFIVTANIDNRWKYLKTELCSLDYGTATYIQQEKERFHASYVVQLAVGVMLCATCWMPVAFLSGVNPLGIRSIGNLIETMAVIFLFVLCAIGVFLLIHGGMIQSSFDDLLNQNKKDTVGAAFSETDEFASPVAGGILSVYWPTVRAIYLIWSFLTFAWYKTWIVWPIAAGIFAVCKAIFRKNDEI